MKFTLVIFLIRISLPIVSSPQLLVQSLTLEPGVKIESLQKLPEYSEYLRQLGQEQIQRPRMESAHLHAAPLLPMQPDSPIAPFAQFPSIHLCKDSPQDNFYGNIYCWIMLALYALVILTLIVYQLRSILWLKEAIPNHLRRQKGYEEPEVQLAIFGAQPKKLDNGWEDDRKNPLAKSTDEKELSRLLPSGQNSSITVTSVPSGNGGQLGP